MRAGVVQALAGILGAFLQFSLISSAHAVSIVHSNDVLGELEPCGCRTNPLGGYARKANFLKGLKGEVIQVDAGDLLFASDKMPEVLQQQSYEQAKWIMTVLEQLHQDAVTPGEKDFSLGVAKFKKLTHGSTVHFLAANLMDRSGKQVLPDSVIITRKGENGKPVRVAILGLVGADLPWPDGLKASDPIAAAKKLVPELKKRADFVLALTHEGYEADRKLASAVPGINAIVGGHSQSFLQNPVQIGKTVLYQSSFRNQYVGIIDVTHYLNADSYRMVGLDAGYDSPSELPGPVDQSIKKFKAKIAEMNSAEMPVAAVQGPHARFQTFPRCAECHLKQFDFWRTTRHATALTPLLKAGQDKNKECLQCHTVGLGQPKGYTSVNELAELTVEDGKPAQFVSNTVFVDYLASIHDAKTLTTPVRGLSSEKEAPLDQTLGQLKRAWVPVQCENCHGPGENHPMSGAYTKTVENQVCLSCHTPTRAPEWYLSDGKPNLELIKEKRAQVSCPAGDMVSGE